MFMPLDWSSSVSSSALTCWMVIWYNIWLQNFYHIIIQIKWIEIGTTIMAFLLLTFCLWWWFFLFLLMNLLLNLNGYLRTFYFYSTWPSSLHTYVIFQLNKQTAYELGNNKAANAPGYCSVHMLEIKPVYVTKNSNCISGEKSVLGMEFLKLWESLSISEIQNS